METNTVQVTKTIAHIATLDTAARFALATCTGAARGGDWGKIVFPLNHTITSEENTLAQTVINAIDTLTVATDKATIDADDTDTATITCNDSAIASDTEVEYRIYLNGALYSEGTAPVAAGEMEDLTLTAPVSGTYRVDIHRTNDDFATGSVTITAE